MKKAKKENKQRQGISQVRPAFGGNIMAQIGITKSRPQFATVRYKVMDKAEVVVNPHGEVVVCPVNEKMAESRIKILSSEVIDKVKSLEEEDVLVVAGRGVRNDKDVEMCRELAEALGGQLAFTRPMVENGFGDTAHQIGLSGRTVRPKLPPRRQSSTARERGFTSSTACPPQAKTGRKASRTAACTSAGRAGTGQVIPDGKMTYSQPGRRRTHWVSAPVSVCSVPHNSHPHNSSTKKQGH